MFYGAAAFLSESKTVEALKLVKLGRVYQLGRVLTLDSPVHPFHGPLFYNTYRRVRDALRMWRGNYGAMNIRIELSDHTGTHIDALNHVSIGERLYGDKQVLEVEYEHGTKELGAENLPPIVTRGILVDVAAAKGVPILEDDYLITLEDVRRALEGGSVKEPSTGDAVIFRTGWGSLWESDKKRYTGPPMPGISIEVAKWLSQKRVSLVGGDTPSVERIIPEPPGTPHVEPVHQHLIVESGIF
ncbi:MAG: cyclase family protein, partial [Nitrososphaerota archaeon]